jgi:transcriptional regulator with XRE-family HTH domain
MADLEPVSGGELLRRYRIVAGLTQEELAERAGLSARAIRALESGAHRSPRKDTLNLLAAALELTSTDRARLEVGMRQHRTAATISPRAALSAQRAPAPLVGRQRERALLEQSLRGSTPPLTLLAGEPGIGKSRLLEEVVEQAAGFGWTTLIGGCHRRSALQPFAPCVDAIAHFLAARTPGQQRLDLHGCAWLARLLPELAERTLVPALTWTLPPEQERRLMFAAVARVLANVAGSAGTLLILDDLHWAGVDALDLLAFLLRESSGHNVRVIGAYRDTDVTAQEPLPVLLSDLAREGLATRIPLAPLVYDDAAQLLTTLLAEVSPMTSSAQSSILARTGGIPFYLVSCAQETRVKAQPQADDAFIIPWSVAESIRQRASLLAKPADDILAIAAVAAHATPREALLLVAKDLGHSEHVTLRALEATTRGRLLIEQPDGDYAFAHDLIRETLEAELSGARRAALHRRLGTALERLPQPERRSEELAWHFAQGDQLARALPYALYAGDHAEAVYAHAESERHYRAAAEWATAIGDNAREGEALEKLAEVEFHFARYETTYACLERAISIYRADENWERLVWTTCQLARAGEPLGKTAASLAVLEELFTVLAVALDRREGAGRGAMSPNDEPAETILTRAGRAASMLTPGTAARMYLCLTSRYLFLGYYQQVYEPSVQAIRFAQQANDLRIESLAYSFRAEAQLAQGEVAAATASLECGRERGEASGNIEAQYIALEGIVSIHESQAEPAHARAALEHMLEAARQLGDAGYVGDTVCALAAFSFLLGEWDEARRYLDHAAAAVRRNEFNRRRTPATVLALLELLQQESASDAALAFAEDNAAGPIWGWIIETLEERDILVGRPEVAATRLRRTIERLDAEPGSACYLFASLAWAESELGERDQAAASLAQARRLSTTLHNRMAHVAIERIEGLLAAHDGRWDDALQALDRSLALCAAMPCPYAEAKARLVCGDVYAARHAPTQARLHYTQALAICERLGERLYRPHIEQALKRLDDQ